MSVVTSRRGFLGGASVAALLSASSVALADKKYDAGAGDGEIKLGHCGPYSGPASAYGVIGKGIEAYWKSVAWPGQGVFIGEPLARPYRRAP